MISIIVAVEADTYAIGKNNDLLYHIPDDLKRFKELTTGNVVIMGWNTFLSLPTRPLPNRENIVITDQPIPDDYMFDDNLIFVTSLEEAIEEASNYEKAYVIGGGYVYNQFINIADEIDFTVIKPKEPAENPDTYFSKDFLKTYRLESKSDEHKYMGKNGKHLTYWFEKYKKI